MRLLFLLPVIALAQHEHAPARPSTCPDSVKILEYRKLNETSDSVVTKFESKAPVGKSVTFRYMIHANTPLGETLHLWANGKFEQKAETETFALTFKKPVIQSATVTDVTVEEGPWCAASAVKSPSKPAPTTKR